MLQCVLQCILWCAALFCWVFQCTRRLVEQNMIADHIQKLICDYVKIMTSDRMQKITFWSRTENSRCMSSCDQKWFFTHMHICMNAGVHSYIYYDAIDAWHICMYMCVCMYMYIDVYKFECMYAGVHMDVCVYIYNVTNIHTYTIERHKFWILIKRLKRLLTTQYMSRNVSVQFGCQVCKCRRLIIVADVH